MSIQKKAILFGLMALVIIVNVETAFSSSLGDEWNSLKSALDNAEKGENQQESLKQLDSAKAIYAETFKSAALEVDTASDKLIEDAFADSKSRFASGDVAQASLNKQIIDKTIYKIAFMKMESSIQQNNSAEFLNWYNVMEKKFKISEKDYASNQLVSEIQSDASLLSANGPVITEELLEIFKLKTIEELEEAIAALNDGNVKDAKKFTYEGLYYYRTLHPHVAEKLGMDTADELLHEMEEAIEISMSGKPVAEMKEGISHILAEVELIIRDYEGGDTSATGLALSGIKDRLNLVQEEYIDAVKDGKIIDQVEYDETVVFLRKATEIFNQNKDTLMKLSSSDATSLGNNLSEINKIVTAKSSPSQVNTLVQKSISNILSLESSAGVSVQTDTVQYIVEIEHLLNEAKTEYRAGNSQMAFDLVTEAYLDNYEFVEGPLGEIDHELMEKIETEMREELRSMIKSGVSADLVDKQIDMIMVDLTEAKMVVPEFGTVALLILMVAITSVIALSRGRMLPLRM